jgi:hypothetical protein
MGEEWSKTIWIGIELSIAALVLTVAVLLSSFAGEMGRVQQREVDAIEITREYRKYNRYDGTQVYPQDIISAIFETRGAPEVWVDITEGSAVNFSYKWTRSIPPGNNMWNLTNVSTLLPTTGTYQASIHRNDNGEIFKIEFRRD